MKKLFFSLIFVILTFIFLIVSFNIATLYQVDNTKVTIGEMVPLHPPSMGNALFKTANLSIPARAPCPLFKLASTNVWLKCQYTLRQNPQPACDYNMFKQSRSFFDSNLGVTRKFYNRTLLANRKSNGDQISAVIKVPILRAINSGATFYANNSVQPL